MSDIEDQLVWQLDALGAPAPIREYVFAAPRRWRFDLAWPTFRLAVEVEGGIWIGGGHSRGVGVTRDVEKYNEAVLRGWTLIRVTSNMVEDGRALAVVERALKVARMTWYSEGRPS